MNDFMELFMSAKNGDSSAMEELLHMYYPLLEDAQHNQEPAISIAVEDIQGLELSGDTNTAMPQIHDSTADTNANEEQAQAS